VSVPRQTLVGKGRVRCCELSITVRRDRDAVEGLVVDRVGEWEWDRCRLIISVVPRVRATWLDTAADLGDIVVVLRRTAIHCVIARECRIRIAPHSGDGPGSNTCCHAASKSEVHREARGRVAVDELDVGHATSNIAGQSQIAGLD